MNNHDMARMNADENGFIDANNWLLTSRGIPVIYYGSEIGFMAGLKEHFGNRNYYGQDKINHAPQSKIYQNLKTINLVRQQTPALQNGLQVNINFTQDTASFLRVLETSEHTQTALVLLNKSDKTQMISVNKWLSAGEWKSSISHQKYKVDNGQLTIAVLAHSVDVLVINKANTDQALLLTLDTLMLNK